MVDVFDRAATMSFSIVASVQGSITYRALENALRALEERHPLLRARVIRDGAELSLQLGVAGCIPLHERHVDEASAHEIITRSIDHREWSDQGPRAELNWLRFDGDRSMLSFTFHHLISDGSSGVIAMRDLLRLLGQPSAMDRVPSPGQDAFFPPTHGGLRDRLRMGWMLARAALSKPPLRLGDYSVAPFEQRRTGSFRLSLTPEQASAVRLRARYDGATIQGVLCAALSLSIGEQCPSEHLQRIVHPVDFRRYLRSRHAQLPQAGDAVGYYVTSVDTDHRIDGAARMGTLAREISRAIQHKKERGEPMLTAPLAGPLFTKRAHGIGIERFRRLAEQRVLRNTYSLTNLGPLEQLDVAPSYGGLVLEDLYFIAAGSVLATLGASASSFQGTLSFSLVHVMPIVPHQVASAVFERTRERLEEYAAC